ncbi:MAG: 50S ribosomal protein L18 [Vallitaleaceae bacterium]|nr:50S ribosomal protein L18 [Vallitaleaceae bacterium]
MIKKMSRTSVREKKHLKLRNKFSGTTERPRLCVYRSNNYVYAQLIDDSKGHTLAASSSKDLGLEKANDVAAAMKVGEDIAKKALAAGVEAVVFDRGGYVYHGKVKALADAAREAGLKF